MKVIKVVILISMPATKKKGPSLLDNFWQIIFYAHSELVFVMDRSCAASILKGNYYLSDRFQRWWDVSSRPFSRLFGRAKTKRCTRVNSVIFGNKPSSPARLFWLARILQWMVGKLCYWWGCWRGMEREFPYESRDLYEISWSLGLGFKRMRTPVVKQIGIARYYLAYAKDF